MSEVSKIKAECEKCDAIDIYRSPGWAYYKLPVEGPIWLCPKCRVEIGAVVEKLMKDQMNALD